MQGLWGLGVSFKALHDPLDGLVCPGTDAQRTVAGGSKAPGQEGRLLKFRLGIGGFYKAIRLIFWQEAVLSDFCEGFCKALQRLMMEGCPIHGATLFCS